LSLPLVRLRVLHLPRLARRRDVRGTVDNPFAGLAGTAPRPSNMIRGVTKVTEQL